MNRIGELLLKAASAEMDLLTRSVSTVVEFPRRELRVIGLDLSLTSSGMSDGWAHHVVQTSTSQCMEERLDHIIRSVIRFVVGTGSGDQADLVVIEAPAFSRTGPGHDELSALRVMVRHRLWRLGIPFAQVPPTTLKKFTTGSGVASKADMAACVQKNYGLDASDYKVSQGRYDIVDALALAAMGYARVGQPIGASEWSQSLDAVTWPELMSD